MPEPDADRAASPRGRQRSAPRDFCAFAPPLQLRSSFSAAEQFSAGLRSPQHDPAVLRGATRSWSPSSSWLSPGEEKVPLRPRTRRRACRARDLRWRHDVDFGMPPVGDEDLVPLRTHSSPALLAVVLSFLTSEPAVRRVDGICRARALISSSCEHSGTSVRFCSAFSEEAMPAAASPVALDRPGMPAQPQWELPGPNHLPLALGVLRRSAVSPRGPEAPAGGLLDHLPGHLPRVVLARGGADHLLANLRHLALTRAAPR